MSCPSCKIDFAALHHDLGGTIQFAVKSIISLGEIESARFPQLGSKTQPKHTSTLHFTLCRGKLD